jgi:16S rRNA (cytidine1402-2'-O)-methyltransferase
MKLYIVATPIGNLQDITLRALEVLKEVDFILCEDTRVTRKLLDKYEIKSSLISYHQHSKQNKDDKIIELLREGHKLALVTDAGTPGISDPGGQLVDKVALEFGSEIEITPIPGACAFVALAQVAGVDLSKFSFLGFPPNKKGREKFFKEVIQEDRPVMYYDSRYRLVKNLELLERLISEGNLDYEVVIGGELTKLHEKIFRGTIKGAIDFFSEDPVRTKGEFVVLLHK